MSGRLSDDKKNRGRRFRLSLFLFDVLLEPSGIYAMSTVLQEGCRYVVRSMSSLPCPQSVSLASEETEEIKKEVDEVKIETQ